MLVDENGHCEKDIPILLILDESNPKKKSRSLLKDFAIGNAGCTSLDDSDSEEEEDDEEDMQSAASSEIDELEDAPLSESSEAN